MPELLAALGQDVETWMPVDFIDASVLELKRPVSRADFAAAFRRRWKKRLTRLV